VTKAEIAMKSTLTLRRGAIATIALLLGSAPAVAQVAPPVSFVEYSAKFLCGVVEAKEPAGAPVRPGIYETSINIHNPQLPLTPLPSVTFVKKAVLALREGEERVRPSQFRRDDLQADFAEQVDCRVIRALLGPTGTAPFIEGFVVLIVFPSPLTTPHELDVVGVYTVDTPQQNISLEMVPIGPRILTLPLAAGRKLLETLEQSRPQ
jgi:hypothetical protein